MKRFIILDKQVGQTPLECAEVWRAGQADVYQSVPLAYAGRLDPMASGKLLVLIGQECKQQEKYHGLDKEYEFVVLFGVSSDTGDVLGLISANVSPQPDPGLAVETIKEACQSLIGEIEVPYPKFSSKTVKGKPLHTWTMEGRLDEIDIPTAKTTIHSLKLLDVHEETGESVYRYATEKIEMIPPVTDERKALGNDFRRPDVRASWHTFHETHAGDSFHVATFRCVCSSGTYMRTLAEVIARELGTTGLAYSIHRTKIGTYHPLPFGFGVWTKVF